MSKTPQAVNYKTTFQLLFLPSMKRASALSDLAGELEGFTAWKLSPGRVICQDFKERNSLNMELGRLTFDQDAYNVEVEKERINNVLSLAEKMDIPEYGRFGFRKKYLAEVDSIGMGFDDLVKIFDLKFNPQSEGLRSWLPPVTNPVFRVDCQDENFLYMISVGPIKKEEIPVHMEFNQEIHLKPEKQFEEYHTVISTYPKVALFMDFDVSVRSEEGKLPSSELPQFEPKAREALNNLSSKFTSYLFS